MESRASAGQQLTAHLPHVLKPQLGSEAPPGPGRSGRWQGQFPQTLGREGLLRLHVPAQGRDLCRAWSCRFSTCLQRPREKGRSSESCSFRSKVPRLKLCTHKNSVPWPAGLSGRAGQGPPHQLLIPHHARLFMLLPGSTWPQGMGGLYLGVHTRSTQPTIPATLWRTQPCSKHRCWQPSRSGTTNRALGLWQQLPRCGAGPQVRGLLAWHPAHPCKGAEAPGCVGLQGRQGCASGHLPVGAWPCLPRGLWWLLLTEAAWAWAGRVPVPPPPGKPVPKQSPCRAPGLCRAIA